MKKHYLFYLLFISTIAYSQSTEDFETETTGATTFTDNGQDFTIINGSGESTYDIEFFASGGWNGSSPDDKFIDNSSGTPPTNDGSSFTISTTDGTDITITNLYLFVSKRNLTTGVSTTITINGKKDGATVYTITKSAGIIDGANFTPNNGFTFIDFTTEGGANNSILNVDELIISTTGNADYIALDAFQWGEAVIPIELITFNGRTEDTNVKLTWKSASELNNKKFEIEASFDGIGFQKIGEIEGKGTTTEEQNYYFEVKDPRKGISYFRLKQIDFDGQFEYSKVISVNFKDENGEAGEFYPNPSKSGFLNLDYSAEFGAELTVSVFDLSGKYMVNQTKQVLSGENNLIFDLSDLNTGMYIVKVGDKVKSTYRKIIIEK
ncbi:T9SS type A sorting domain-containing protein [Portibacter lacus]|uniref:Secretion system C-terminal sorting domain-containing protein n=1 Tax=Portibacter lacus TaxID=1099794 RepID=A0AA37SRN2_9BACT|nr:T9SS type A sorting domain-containing protein [Portibacter lacus]GLR18249.1 hypothetical protein GCM10007940_28650 [Portibacter lacus]